MLKIYEVQLLGNFVKMDLFLDNLINKISYNGYTSLDYVDSHNVKKLCITFKTYLDIFQLMELFKDYNFDISTKYVGDDL